MSCPDPELIERMMRGELPPDQAAELQSHVSGCASCTTRVDELSSHQDFLQDLVGAFPTGAPALPSTQSAPIPDAIGEYEVLEEIGRGGMGAILKVHDPKLRRTMALKLVHADASGAGLGDLSQLDLKSQVRFQEEAQVTSQLAHPGIVPVFELGRVGDGRPFFTMQLVEGRNLRQVFGLVEEEQEGWNQTRALGVILRVCEAMAYAHSKGVIHRDLKPANIMVGEFGEVYVMDWGVARVTGTPDAHDLRLRERTNRSVTSERHETRAESPDSPLVTMDGDVIGTPVYMSPEQAEGRIDELSMRSDVYSVGAMLYHLLSKQVPYVKPGTRPDSHVVLARVMDGPPQPLAEIDRTVPAELVAICEKAMARVPAQRYRDMREMAQDLRAYLERRVVSAYETGALAEFRKWVARNRALATAASLAILATITGLAATLAIQARANHAKQLKTDLYGISYLKEEAAKLWPPNPELIDALSSWLELADGLASRRGAHEVMLASLTEADEDYVPQTDFLVDLTELHSAGGLRDDVAQRLEFASTIRERSVTGGEIRDLWSGAIASIADPKECPLYEGLKLEPQLGLVPLGQDRETRLWEFGHLLTGELPRRDPVTGKLRYDEACGLVFVLVPGGSFAMGNAPEGQRGYDAKAEEERGEREMPQAVLTLDPFFLSKYEMSQAQWQRLERDNPARYRPGMKTNGEDRLITLLHPIESVSWGDCAEVLRKLGLDFPTEAQWEYAARAGETGRWGTGDEPETLIGHANLADLSARDVGANWPQIGGMEWLRDGYAVHAPVDQYLPNAFGLHNVHGNVWEWCRDRYCDARECAEFREGDGERIVIDQRRTERAYRGGGFKYDAHYARCAYRADDPPGYRDNYLGLRPIRRVAE